ncbi:MAG TPA: NADH-quinone oxidoreductase subunit J [Parachlamydiaceae bacterium]|nr:NADH-quinone oxidoreductase subunit J [Parachlamydiaceae bacterium]
MELFLHPFHNFAEVFLGSLLILSSILTVSLKNPVHASLTFLAALLTLATVYIERSAEFIGIMQVLVYAGAILIIFMFVIIMFQDAHEKLNEFKPKTGKSFVLTAAGMFLAATLYLLKSFLQVSDKPTELKNGFGTVQNLGQALYLDFFFPFESVVFLFLVAIIGAFYMGKK